MQLEEFYNSPVAAQMAEAYKADAISPTPPLENFIRHPGHPPVCLPRETVDRILQSLYTLRRFYRQKFIPRQRIRELDEIISELEG